LLLRVKTSVKLRVSVKVRVDVWVRVLARLGIKFKVRVGVSVEVWVMELRLRLGFKISLTPNYVSMGNDHNLRPNPNPMLEAP
jgi:hypothetical protein